jgi:hypothetical protein
MSSLHRFKANRLNALKSTGPRTPEGKERSRANAVRHGLTAETVISDLEDKEDYVAFEAAVIADYDAESATQRELVLRLASVLWRLRRATAIETALFDLPEPEENASHAPPVAPIALTQTTEPAIGALARMHQSQLRAPDLTVQMRALAQRFLHLAAQPTFPLDRLSRYEHTLWRQARQLVFTLESLRRRKQEPRRFSFPFSISSHKERD